MKRFWAFCLMLVMLFSLAACAPTDPGGGGGGGGGGDDTNLDSVPTKDFGGETVTINLLESYLYEVYKEEAEPDACNVAIRNRNSKIENRFNVKIVPDYEVGVGAGDHCDKVRNALNNGDAEFDLTLTQLWLTGPMVTSGLYFDLRYEVPYVKDSIGTNAWWGAGINDAFTIHDRQYIGSTDINLSSIKVTWCVLFNKKHEENMHIAQSLGEANMYDVVKNNKWTLDALYDLAKDICVDNPQGTTPGEVGVDDTFGVLAQGMWWAEIAAASAGIRMIVNNGQDTPELTPFTSFTTIADRIAQINNAKGFLVPTSSNGIVPSTKFSAGEALFYMTTFSVLENDEIHDSDVEFGVLPMPKGSTTQAKYNAAAQDAASVIGVPTSADSGGIHFDAVCSVLEALAAESHKSVLPAYYDVILKHKNTRDEESLEMIDLIYEGRIFDFAAIHSYSDDELKFSLNGVPTGLMYVMRQFASNPSLCGTAWEAGRDVLQGRLDEIIDTYEGLYDREGE